MALRRDPETRQTLTQGQDWTYHPTCKMAPVLCAGAILYLSIQKRASQVTGLKALFRDANLWINIIISFKFIIACCLLYSKSKSSGQGTADIRSPRSFRKFSPCQHRLLFADLRRGSVAYHRFGGQMTPWTAPAYGLPSARHYIICPRREST